MMILLFNIISTLVWVFTLIGTTITLCAYRLRNENNEALRTPAVVAFTSSMICIIVELILLPFWHKEVNKPAEPINREYDLHYIDTEREEGNIDFTTIVGISEEGSDEVHYYKIDVTTEKIIINEIERTDENDS